MLPDPIERDVHVERRTLLMLPAALAAAVIGCARLVAQETRPAAARVLALDDLLERAQELARAAGDPTPRDEDAYLLEVAALAVRLGKLPDVKLEKFPIFDNVESARLGRRAPVSAHLFRVAPDTRIPLHDHRGHSGVMLGIEGEFRVRNFEPVEPATRRAGDFVVRQTTDVLVTPGRVSTLSRTRDNMHLVSVGRQGGLALDLFTMPAGGAGGGDLFDLDEKPVDAGQRLFTARRRR